MDLILLDTRPASAHEPRTFSAAGCAALERLIAWFAADQIPTEIYVELPGDAVERAFVLTTLSGHFRDLPAVIYVLVPVLELTPDLIGALDENELRNVLLVGSEAPLPLEAEALRHLSAYLEAHPNSRLALGAWVSDRAGSENLRRVRQFQLAGISPEVINAPLFFRTVDGLTWRGDTPSDLLAGLAQCGLYRNALTMDGDGSIHLCPRHQGGLELGNLFTAAPEELVTAKGRHAAGVGAYPACRSCDLAGRFAWPERKTARLEELMAAGAFQPGQGTGDPLAGFESIAHRDLGSADDSAVAADLGAFDERLRAWQRAMTETHDAGV